VSKVTTSCVSAQGESKREGCRPPAQIIFSGVQGRREAIVPTASYGTLCTTTPSYCTAFPNGFTTSSQIWGGQFAVQLPTRWFTLVASAYRGGCYLAAGCALLGTNASGQVVVAPEKPIHTFGGFVNLGLPLSRWFNANPKGHNAGWQLYLHMGKDQVASTDMPEKRPQFLSGGILAPLPLRMGTLAAATLYYKVNPYVTFGFEQSIYATRLDANYPVTGLSHYTIAGQPSNEWKDHRTEFGPILTF